MRIAHVLTFYDSLRNVLFLNHFVRVLTQTRHYTTKGTHLVKTYAFLDPGSSDTFCTEVLMSELKVNGRRTDILLRIMGDEKQVKIHIVSGLEISSLDGDQFVQLPVVFTQRTIPVHKGNIPQQKVLERWQYLKDVCLPSNWIANRS